MIFLFKNNFSLSACQIFQSALLLFSVYVHVAFVPSVLQHFFFSSLSISRLFCILDKSARMFTRRKPFSCELNLLWAQKAVESSRMSCCSSTWSVSSADPVPWSQRCLANGGLALCPGWLHKALVSYFCEQKLLWAARASHLGHTGRKSHLLTEFYWVMMELSFMVSRWGLSGFRWWLALLAE